MSESGVKPKKNRGGRPKKAENVDKGERTRFHKPITKNPEIVEELPEEYEKANSLSSYRNSQELDQPIYERPKSVIQPH